VRDIDRRHPEAGVELGERRAHADPELRVEVRERLVHQECLRLSDDRPAHRHSLPLPAGQLRRPAVEQLREPQQLGDLLDSAPGFGLRKPAHLEAVAEVLANAHVRIERVALEDHRHVALARRLVGDVLVTDRDPPGSRLFQAGDQAKQRGLSATRSTDKHHELAVLDRQAEITDRRESVRKGLRHALENDPGHLGSDNTTTLWR
jgi:hypothetical protein